MRGYAVAVVAALAACLAGAGAAQADVVWLCLPGQDPNPCHESLETTVQAEDGEHVENPPLASDPAVDCFYVYPTVSQQRSRNADKSKDPEVIAIAQYQANRFAQACRVYAPVYRQQTLGGLALGGSAESLQLAYSDVEEAWKEYLRTYNGGRGVVLIGHSQGTRMLRRLLREQIDPVPDLRARLVSAILLGGNVLVRKGSLVGGDFAHVPACSAAGETGCVMAFSTFNEPPPSNSRYGRSPAEDTSGFNMPFGPDYDVLCTNPASLGANEQRELTTLLRSEPFPGVIGLLLLEMYGGPPPSASTPWLQPRERYTGRCETSDGANVFMIDEVGDARKLNPAPDPSWGLHLADVNIALGDLVRAVEAQIATYTAPPAREATSAPECRRSGRRVTVVGARGVRRVDFRRGRQLLVRDRTAPFGTRLRRGRGVRAVAWFENGRRAVLACA